MLRVVNWDSFQSYKDRSPPWIRLHKKLLDDRNFQKMSADSRALLPMLWLLAAEDKDPVSGLLRDCYEDISWRLRMPNSLLLECINEIVENGFIEVVESTANPVNTPRDKNVTELLRNCHPETETETDIYREQNPVNKKSEKKNGQARFTKPTVEEIQAYITEKKYSVSAIRFFNHYEANGWKVGKNKMVSWKHAVANWNSNTDQEKPQGVFYQ